METDVGIFSRERVGIRVAQSVKEVRVGLESLKNVSRIHTVDSTAKVTTDFCELKMVRMANMSAVRLFRISERRFLQSVTKASVKFVTVIASIRRSIQSFPKKFVTFVFDSNL